MLSGQSLAAVLPPPTPLDSGLRRNDDWGAGMTSAGAILRESPIPDRSPGCAFVPMTTCGLRAIEMALVC